VFIFRHKQYHSKAEQSSKCFFLFSRQQECRVSRKHLVGLDRYLPESSWISRFDLEINKIRMTDETRESDVATSRKTSLGVAIVELSKSANGLDITAKVEDAPEADVTGNISSKVDADPAVVASEIHQRSNRHAPNKVNGRFVDKSSSNGASCRRLQRKPHVDRRRRRHPGAVLTIERTASRRKRKSNIAEAEIDESSEEDFGEPEMQRAIKNSESKNSEQTKEPFAGTVAEVKERDSSTIERSLPDRRSLKDQLIEIRSASRSGSRLKERKAKGILRSTLERKVEAIEKIVEDRVERIWEQNVEKHSWLQPIDAWIGDHCKPSANYTIAHCQDDDRSAAYDFKFTAAGQDGEPTIVSGTRIDSSLESRITTQLRRLRDRAGSSSRFEPASARLRKQENPPRAREEDKPKVLIDPDVLEVKEAKRYYLLDRLRDGVREKMEEIQRVAVIEIVLYLYELYLFKLTPQASDIFRQNRSTAR